MAYTALYRQYRPKCFDEMVGQGHITKTLKNQIISNKVGHAYLFTGSRGTGKTSAAKILARAVNCLNPKNGEPCNECEICKAALSGSLTDIVEMDAASNTSVDDIRVIREEVNFLPTLAKYRVYIIDEVHMLSSGAFNALLKTLEEPPEHVKFILATTEPQKLLPTIVSRCQRFDFKRISNDEIISRLKYVCNESKIEISDEALNTIAVLSEGGMRDSLSILERCIQEGETKIDNDLVRDLVGIPKLAYINNIFECIINNDQDRLLIEVQKTIDDGKDLQNINFELIKYAKDILIYKATGHLDIYSEEELKVIHNLAEKVDKDRIFNIIIELSELTGQMRASTQKQILFEVTVLKLANKDIPSKQNVEVKNPVKIEEKPVQIKSVEVKSIEKSKIEEKKEESIKQTGNLDFKKIVNENYARKPMIKMALESAVWSEPNDTTVEIKFTNPTKDSVAISQLKDVAEKSNLEKVVSMELGNPIHIKYVTDTVLTNEKNSVKKENEQVPQTIEQIANQNDIPFKIEED